MDSEIQVSRQQVAETIEEWYKYKIKRYTYQWTIDDFSHRVERTGQFISSPTLSGRATDRFIWSMGLYPRGLDKQNCQNISICLNVNQYISNKGELRARYKLSIVDEQGNRRNVKDTKHPVIFALDHQCKYNWMCYNFIRRDILLDSNRGLLPGDKLTIHCEIDVLIEPMEYSQPEDQSKAATSELLDHFERLYDSQLLTDVTISVGDEQFKAHKAILAARSPVFKAMFGHNMKEAQENSIEVADIHPDVFQEVLRFIYTGKSSIIETKRPIKDTQEADQLQVVADLLIASDKYQIEGLALICERALIELFSLDSVGKLLLLADSFHRTELKAKVIQFICENYGQLFQTNSWVATFKEAPTQLIVEVNKHVFSAMNTK